MDSQIRETKVVNFQFTLHFQNLEKIGLYKFNNCQMSQSPHEKFGCDFGFDLWKKRDKYKEIQNSYLSNYFAFLIKSCKHMTTN